MATVAGLPSEPTVPDTVPESEQPLLTRTLPLPLTLPLTLGDPRAPPHARAA